MIPRMTWRNRLRLALAVWKGQVWLYDAETMGWGQQITLRTAEDIEIIQEDQ